MRLWIQKSDKLMQPDFPNRDERSKNLSELYEEPTGTILDALEKEENRSSRSGWRKC